MDSLQLIRRGFLIFALVVSGIASLCYSHTAAAQAPTMTCTGTLCDRQQAYAECQSLVTYLNTTFPGSPPVACRLNPSYPASKNYLCGTEAFPSNCMIKNTHPFRECDAPGHWDEATKTCSGVCEPGEVEDPEHPGQCLNSQKCLARNVNILGDGVRSWQSKCVSGCEIAMADGGSATTAGGESRYRGRFEYNGNLCSGGVVQTPDPDGTRTEEKTKPQECFAGTNPLACVKADGMQCAAVSGGRQLCWRPGEVGTKTDGPIAQIREPGHIDGPVNRELPNGQIGEKTGNTVQTTITNNIGGSTTTISTSTTNYTSPNGTDAGGKNMGEKGDGSGADKEGEGDDEKGSASTNCNVPPTCSSSDSIGCAMVRQSWNNHCEMQKDLLNNPDPDGNGDFGLSDQGKVFDSGSGGNDNDGWGSVDTDGWAGRGSCPIVLNFTVMGTTFNVDHPQLCDLLDALAALVLVVGAFHAAVILAGGNR